MGRRKDLGGFKDPSIAMGLRKTPATSHCRLNESRGSLENVPTKLGRGTWPRFGELKTFPNGKPKVTTSEDQKERGQKRRHRSPGFQFPRTIRDCLTTTPTIITHSSLPKLYLSQSLRISHSGSLEFILSIPPDQPSPTGATEKA